MRIRQIDAMDYRNDIIILGRSRRENPPRPGMKVFFKFCPGIENSRAFKYNINVLITPGKSSGIFFTENLISCHLS